MKPRHTSIARDQRTAVCATLAVSLLLWVFGFGLPPQLSHPGERSAATVTRATFTGLADSHHDLARASIAAIRTAPSRGTSNSSTRIAAAATALRLVGAGFRSAEERRPVTLSPHLSQIRLRAPPSVLA